MALNREVAWGKIGSLFQSSVQQTVDVGSAANRVAYVLIGNLADPNPLPSSVTIGSDTLSSSQAQFTDVNTFKWRLYYGALTVTGSQSITATENSNAGQVVMVGVVYSGVDAALLESYDDGNTFGNSTWSSASIASATNDKVVALMVTNDTETITGTNGTSIIAGTTLGSGSGQFVLEEDGAASVTLSATFNTIMTERHAAFNVPAGESDATIRPNSDISVSGWTTTPSGAVYSVIDEAVPSDTDYASSPTITGVGQKAILGLSNGPLAAGAWSPAVRAATSGGAAKLRISLLNDSNDSQGQVDIDVTSTPTRYDPTITTTGAATRISFEFISAS